MIATHPSGQKEDVIGFHTEEEAKEWRKSNRCRAWLRTRGHAWLQAYIPGPGWVDFDPSAGTMGNENLVRVAAVAHPHEAIQGTRYGHASDHLAMTVAVKVNLVD